MKKELTAEEVALYFGCEAVVLPNNGIGILTNIDASGFAVIEIPKVGLFTTNYFALLLRNPSSITLDEMRENHEAYKQGMKLGLLAHGTAASTRHWISLHIDLFGWIEAGLAIEKTETP